MSTCVYQGLRYAAGEPTGSFPSWALFCDSQTPTWCLLIGGRVSNCQGHGEKGRRGPGLELPQGVRGCHEPQPKVPMSPRGFNHSGSKNTGRLSGRQVVSFETNSGPFQMSPGGLPCPRCPQTPLLSRGEPVSLRDWFPENRLTRFILLRASLDSSPAQPHGTGVWLMLAAATSPGEFWGRLAPGSC